MTADFRATIKKHLEGAAGLDELIAVVRRHRDDGASQDAIYAVLESLRSELDEVNEDPLLEVMDVVLGHCRPELRLWPVRAD